MFCTITTELEDFVQTQTKYRTLFAESDFDTPQDLIINDLMLVA